MRSEGINSPASIRKRKKQQSLSPKEKILLEKRLDYVPSSNHKGPNIGLFFHELIGNETLPKKLFGLLWGIFGVLLFLLTFPLFSLLIGFSSKGKVIHADTCFGLHGSPFTRYSYNIYQSADERTKGMIGKLLHKTRLNRLPNFINLVKGEMALVGPSALPDRIGHQLNAELTDFYKRFAVKPGIIGIGDGRRSVERSQDFSDWEKILGKELYYVAKPTLKKDLKIILGKFEQEKPDAD